MIIPHLDAILARLRAHPDLAGIVFDEAVTTSPAKYVVVYTDSGRDVEPRLSGPTTVTEFTYTVHSIGKSRRSALWVAERVKAQLVNFIPTVAGYSCSRLTHPVARPVQADTSSNPPLWYVVDQFDLSTTPSA